MIDNDMTNILKNFAEVGNGTVTDAKTGEAKVNHAAQDKNAMKALLEGLDAQQKSVNQMPGTHNMAKNGAKHPAEKFLVGGEFDDEFELSGKAKDDEDLMNRSPKSYTRDEPAEFNNGMQVKLHPDFAGGTERDEVFTLSNWDGQKGWVTDANDMGWQITADQIIPVETDYELDEADVSGQNAYDNTYADEKAFGLPPSKNSQEKAQHRVKPGVNVHVGHHVPGGSGIEGEVTKVKDGYVYIKNAEGQTYKGQLKNTTLQEEAVEEDTISKRAPPRTQMNKKQSFADIFRSMDETEEDMGARFKKELHDERQEKALNKGTNGKFDLAERYHDGEELSWGDEMLEDLKLLLHDAGSLADLQDGVLSLIQQYETQEDGKA